MKAFLTAVPPERGRGQMEVAARGAASSSHMLVRVPDPDGCRRAWAPCSDTQGLAPVLRHPGTGPLVQTPRTWPPCSDTQGSKPTLLLKGT
ncbi:unnamed protein product [Gadus morhua 'NCC']